MSTVALVCAQCGAGFSQRAGHRNRQVRLFGAGVRSFCSRACSGASKRDGLSKAEKVRLKAEYDAQYHERNRDTLRAKAAAYHLGRYSKEVGRADREARRAAGWSHSEYCRRYYADPERKAEKVEYDARIRSEAYGTFAEAHRLLIELEREIRRQSPDKYERARARGYYQRGAQQRRRDAGIERSR